MFADLGDTIHRATGPLPHITPNTAAKTAKTLTDLEHQADRICHKLYHEAESTFITPIDREDIHTLAKTMDNIIDLTEDVASKLVLYNGSLRITPEFHAFSKLIRVISGQTRELVSQLKGREKNVLKMKKLIRTLHDLEHDGDRLLRTALKTLFSSRKNAVAIIQWKDLYEILEHITDEGEHVADIVEEIIIKNF